MSLLDKVSLCVTPNAYKESKLYSVVPNTALGDMDVVRATTATRVNSSGLIEVVPRNLLQYSNVFNNGVWSVGSTITLTSGQVGYDGTNNAWLLSKGAILYPAIGQSVSNSGTKTLSVYAKANTNTKICLFASASASNFYQDFDLSNGTLGPNSFGVVSTLIENVGNGWYRCSVVFNGTTTDFNIFPDDILGANAGSVFIQNSQIESGLLTEYFHTTTRLNIPRIDYTNGSCPSLLVEPQRTNVNINSNNFVTGWNNDGTSVQTNNFSISPDGTQNASRTTSLTSAGYLYKILPIIPVGNYTYSIYIKASITTNINLAIQDIGGIGITQRSIALTTNWQRFDITANITLGTFVTIGASAFQLGINYDFYGAQLEAGSYPTSYIPTVASTVTRNADVISKTGISSLIGQTEGTLFFDGIVTNTTGLQIGNSDGGGDYNNSIQIAFGTSSTNVNIFVAGIPQFSNASAVSTGRNKIAIAYKANDFSLYINGFQIATDSSGSIPTLSGLFINHQNLGTTNGFINSIQLYKTRLTNSELAQLTTL